MDSNQNPIAEYLEGRRPPPKKATGRPRKRTPEHFAAVLRGLAALRAWFIGANGREPASDTELLKAFRMHVQSLGGEGDDLSGSLEEQFFQRLKTTLNVFGQARRYFAEHPEKAHLFGVEPEWFVRCNRPHRTKKPNHAPTDRLPSFVFHLASGVNA